MRFAFLLSVLVISATQYEVQCLQQAYKAFIPSSQIEWFNNLVAKRNDLDVWLSPRVLSESLFKRLDVDEALLSTDFLKKYHYYCEFRLTTNGNIEKFKELFKRNNVLVELIISDLESHFETVYKRDKRQSGDDGEAQTSQDSSPASSSNLQQLSEKVINKYASTLEVVSWLLQFAKANSDLVKLNLIGRSLDGRPIIAVVITGPNRKKFKPLFYFDAGIHAREWITVPTAVFLIDKLVKDYRNGNPTIKKILNQHEVHVVPIHNPDGFEFSRSSPANRLWRKNMRFTRLHSSEHACFGVDLNRNYDHKWMVAGASANPCNEIYAGLIPASEPETVAISAYLLSKKNRWLSYISLHSYGADWLSAYSYSKNHIASNFEDTCRRARSAIDKINTKYNAEYNYGAAAHVLYEASGCSLDWAKAIAGINHTFTVELKPTVSDAGRSGFEVPEKKVAKITKEAYESFVEFMKTFLPGYDFKQSIVAQCKKQLNDMIMTVESYSREQTAQEKEDYDF